ncbi:Snf7-domain-containing protein [Ramicandelaber brevisporus]|nr:Snf7-domain-containing protein [Ramicandelaber brevisporus]
MDGIIKYFKGPTPEEQVRKWKQGLRSQERTLDREIRAIQQQEQKTKAEIKRLAKRGDQGGCRMLAREVIRARKQTERLAVSKARLGSIGMELQHQLALAKVTGALKQSTAVMKNVNTLVRLPQLQATMQEMSKEMMKAGIIAEMQSEVLDGLDNDLEEDMETEAESEVQKVLAEIVDGRLAQAGQVPSQALPVEQQVEVPATAEQPEEILNDEFGVDGLPSLEDMQRRLELLRSD